MTVGQKTGTKQLVRYIRLSPTVLYRVPGCYGSKPDPLSDACIHCVVRKQCAEKQEVVWR